MSTQPTDAELDALWRFEASKKWDSTLAMRTSFTRAVLAKWGSPVVAGEPVAWQYRAAHEGLWFDCGEDRAKQRAAHPDKWEVRPLFTAPQPTQMQAGAVPLTEAQRNAVWEEHRYSDGEGWVVDCESIIDAVEAAHGIKEPQ